MFSPKLKEEEKVAKVSAKEFLLYFGHNFFRLTALILIQKGKYYSWNSRATRGSRGSIVEGNVEIPASIGCAIQK